MFVKSAALHMSITRISICNGNIVNNLSSRVHITGLPLVHRTIYTHTKSSRFIKYLIYIQVYGSILNQIIAVMMYKKN